MMYMWIFISTGEKSLNYVYLKPFVILHFEPIAKKITEERMINSKSIPNVSLLYFQTALFENVSNSN